MSWKNTIITGVLTGVVLGSGAYVALSRIGAELMLQSTYEPYTLSEGTGCGLEPASACITLDGVVYSSLVAAEEVPKVVNHYGLQPFGTSYEDELTGRNYLQPVDVSKPQVTLHSQWVQGSW